jgi:uncharacterized Zn finger protein (UPF0148 family)
MSCNHVNPAGYAFCATCGEALERARCRCGFVTGAGDIFCGRCGINLAEAATGAVTAAADADHRFDLEQLALQSAQEKQFMETTHKVHVTQDDIRKLLTKRRKRF